MKRKKAFSKILKSMAPGSGVLELILWKSFPLPPIIKQMNYKTIIIEECVFQNCEVNMPWIRGSSVKAGL